MSSILLFESRDASLHYEVDQRLEISDGEVSMVFGHLSYRIHISGVSTEQSASLDLILWGLDIFSPTRN